MPFKPDLINEANALVRFNLNNTQQGLKIHADAGSEIVSATQRLFDKGLLTQPDGGYLTDLGQETAEHLQAAFTILGSSN